MTTEIKGDLLAIEKGIICQQVNCMGRMNSGLAGSMRDKYPIVYESYMSAHVHGTLRLGFVLFVTIPGMDLVVANLCGQHYYGGKGLYTDYQAVRDCLRDVAKTSRIYGQQVYIPLKMSCGLAGGNWDIVLGSINDIIPNAIIVNNN